MIYPVLNFEFEFDSYTQYDGYKLRTLAMRHYWKQYLHGTTCMKSSNIGLHPYQSPLQGNINKMPQRTLLVSARFDILIDEQRLFASQLSSSDTNIYHYEYPTMHGFMALGSLNSYAMDAFKAIHHFCHAE